MLASVLSTLLLVGCGSNDDVTDEKSIEKADTKSSKVILKSASRDVNYMVNQEGESLYTFDKDTLNISNCDAACQEIWPLLLASITENEAFGLAENSTSHTTYLQHPLYTFVNDINVGDVNGDRVKNVWHLVYPNNDFVGITEAKLSSSARTQSYLTTTEGLALYTFDKDEPNKSNCVDSCLVAWPLYNAEVDLNTLPSGVEASKFGMITRDDGIQQVTYNEKPLYTFANDTAENKTAGDWKKGVWHLVDLGSL